jgi:transposase
MDNLSSIFGGKQQEQESDSNVQIEKLYAQIGQLKVENDFLKKSARKLGIPDNELKW